MSLSIWTIYDHPSDYPNSFVVRKWTVDGNGPKPEQVLAITDTLEKARAAIPGRSVRMQRFPDDDPCIAETWI